MARIGLLEDNAQIAKICATMLCYAGHKVSIYEHPRDCLRALQLFSDVLSPDESFSPLKSLPIDVLILDLDLPDITGLEIIHLLCSQPRTKSMPLIFCTAAPANEISQALRLAPKADFLKKPFSYGSLVSAITNALVHEG